MLVTERDKLVHEAGKTLGEKLKGFFGRVVFNIQDGRYVNANIEQSIRPETDFPQIGTDEHR